MNAAVVRGPSLVVRIGVIREDVALTQRIGHFVRRHPRWGARGRRARVVALARLWLRLGPIAPALLDLTDSTSTVVVDRRGVPLYEALSGRRNAQRPPSTRTTCPPALVAATIAAEDRRFWSHVGVDPVAIVRALRQNLVEGRIVEGGSTITQQVAKLLLNRRTPGRTRGWGGKVREAVLALRLEHRFDKREILAMYLNLAAYGNQIVGAERASRAYFGCEASMLTSAQAAFLAGLPQRPSRFNPYRNRSRRSRGSGPCFGGWRRPVCSPRRTRRRRATSSWRSPGAPRRSWRRTSSRWCWPRHADRPAARSRRRSTPGCRTTSPASSGASGRRSRGTAPRTSRSSCSTTSAASGWRGRDPGDYFDARARRRDQRPRHAAPARLGAQAVHLCAGVRGRAHAGDRAGRRAVAFSDRGTGRALQPAQLRRPIPRSAAGAARARRLRERPGRRARVGARRAEAAPLPLHARVSPRFDRNAVVLRPRPHARQRRGPTRRARRRVRGVCARR